MKKMFLVLFFTLMAATCVHAEDTDTSDYSAESISNLVATVKARTLACDPKRDHTTVGTATGKIRRFYEAFVLSESTLDREAQQRACTALAEFRLCLSTIQDRIDEAVDYVDMRMETLPSPREATGTAYGIDLSEANSMLRSQFSRDAIILDRLSKNLRKLDAQLKEKIAAHSPSSLR